MERGTQGGVRGFLTSVTMRVIVYYAALAATYAIVRPMLPEPVFAALQEGLNPLLGSGALEGGGIFGRSGMAATPAPALGSHGVALMTLVAISAALLLSLPVSWVYMSTRRKKGYSQAVVHTLILLPVVVAGIAVLVKNSVALAFSLAGVVAAVRFRTTLDDSKDAVFIFLAVALGLACGVQIEVAAILSMLFVFVTLLLWHTDYARLPPDLEGVRAQRQMQRAMSIANRTSQFVAKLDHEILETMAPAQLDALASRVAQRREELGDVAPASVTAPRYDGRLTVVVSDDEEARPLIEAVLEQQTKRWRLTQSQTTNDGVSRLVYQLRLRKGVSAEVVGEIVTRDAAPYVSQVETGL